MKPLFKTSVLKCSLSDIPSSSMTKYLPTTNSNANALSGYTVLEFGCFRIENTFCFYILMSFDRGCKVRIIVSLPVCVWVCEREL